MAASRRTVVHSINVAEGIVPLGEFKAQAARYLRGLPSRDHPLVITQNGKPVAVVLSPLAFEDLRARQDHLEAIARGVEDADAGRVVDHGRVRDWLSSWGTRREQSPPK